MRGVGEGGVDGGVAHSGGIAREEKRIRWLQLAAAAQPRAHVRVEVVAARDSVRAHASHDCTSSAMTCER